jgi:acyl carrier protein
MDNIAEKLIALTEHYSGVSNVTLTMHLKTDLELDSLSLTELVVACEDEFGIEIDMDHPSVRLAATLKDFYDGIVLLKQSPAS